MIAHADLDDRSRVVPVIGHSVVTVAALLPISGVLGLAVLGTDFYLGHTGKSFGPTLGFMFLGPSLVLLALASGGLLSRIWSAPGATGDLDMSAIPAVTGGAASAVFAIGINALLWIVIRTELHGTGSVLHAAAICAGPSALLAPAAIAGAIRLPRQPKAADRIRRHGARLSWSRSAAPAFPIWPISLCSGPTCQKGRPRTAR